MEEFYLKATFVIADIMPISKFKFICPPNDASTDGFYLKINIFMIFVDDWAPATWTRT
jgi:hypothetical protein